MAEKYRSSLYLLSQTRKHPSVTEKGKPLELFWTDQWHVGQEEAIGAYYKKRKLLNLC